MSDKNSVTDRRAVTGTAFGALGVLAFSLSLPATRLAVHELDPWFVAFGRAVGAALLASAHLAFSRAPLPTPTQRWRLAVVALGVVVGFPVFTSLALTTQTAAHGAVVVAALPAVTAVLAVVRAGERSPPLFWAAGAAGLLAVLAFLVTTGTVRGGLAPGDMLLLAAVVLCGLGYAEGGALARQLGGARTISWALLIALPVTLPVTAVAVAAHPPQAGAAAWSAFGYLTAVSMFLGFHAWYTGLARGGVARVGQVQLAQPVLTLLWSALLLGETVPAASFGVALVVLACVALAQRTRGAPTDRTPAPAPVPVRPATPPA